jgi:hypothetical protein
MNWKDIQISQDATYFIFQGNPIFNKRFKEVLKFHAPGLAPVYDETGAYHIDVNGTQLYEKRYTRTFGFYCNRAAVIQGSEWFHLNTEGERAYADTYAWTGNFQEDFCTVRNAEGHYFHINLDGTRAYLEVYRYAGDFKDGIACVMGMDGLFRHIDAQGKFIHNKAFLDLGIFHKQFATAKDEGGWHHIDKTGKALYLNRYQSIEPFYNGYALATSLKGEKVILNERGEEIINVQINLIRFKLIHHKLN